MAQLILERAGYEVCTATDGVEAVELFRENAGSFRAVLLDLTMPRMSGEAVLSEIRKLRPDLPVVLTSGYDKEATMPADLDDIVFLRKPFDAEGLAAAVDRAVSAVSR